MLEISRDELRFTFFLLTLKNGAKQWENSLKHGKETTWEELIEKFMKKVFPLIENTRRRLDLMLFKQRDRENLHDAWSRFKLMVKLDLN